MPCRLLVLGAATVFIPACAGGAEQAGGSSREADTTRYELVSIGGRPLSSRSEALRTCNLRPYHAGLVIADTTWQRGDSTFAYCGGQNPDTNPRLTQSSGTLVIRLDTLEFRVADTTIGVRGLLTRGLRRADSVIVFGSDLDGGDYIFRRVNTTR